jgi:hypothetical protein
MSDRALVDIILERRHLAERAASNAVRDSVEQFEQRAIVAELDLVLLLRREAARLGGG